MSDIDHDYTLIEAAEAIRMSERWLRGRIAADKIEHTRRGHKIMFTAAQMEKLRAAHAVAPAPEVVTTGRKRKSA